MTDNDDDIIGGPKFNPKSIRLKLPRGATRDTIVSKGKEHRIHDGYDRMIEEDYELNRAQYHQTELYGVPVLVKLKNK